MKRKKNGFQASLVCVIVCALLVFSGCTSNNGPAADSGSSANTGQTGATTDHQAQNDPKADKDNEKEVTLEFWAYPKWNGVNGTEKDGKLGDWELDAAKRFMALHPNVKIETKFLDPKGGPEKVQIAIQTDSIPNVLEDSSIRIFQYSLAGLMAPLDAYLDAEYTKDYFPGLWADAALSNGKHYYLPFVASPNVMMVNKSLFKQANAEHLLPQNPERTWTQEQYLEAMKAIAATFKDRYGVGLSGNTTSGDNFALIWLWASGASTFDPDHTRITLNSPEGIQGLKFVKSLIDQKYAAPGAAGLSAGDAVTLFNQQKVATVSGATVQYARLVNQMNAGQLDKFEVELVMVPNAEGKSQVTVQNTNGFAVFKDKDPDVQRWSAEFVKFLGSKENAAAVKAGQSFSAWQSHVNMYDDDADDNMKFAAGIAKYTVDWGLQTPGFTKQRDAYAKELQAVFTDQKTPEQALADFEQAGNKILEAAAKEVKE